MHEARDLICYLIEAANLDKALVGIEIELGLRLGLDTPQLNDFLERHGFKWTHDRSVTMRKGSLEQYYDDFELVSIDPMPWSHLNPELEAVLAFLKREDDVEVQRTSAPVHTKTVTPLFPGEKQRKFLTPTKVIRLPRARVPSNFSAATHLHFDYRWFDSVNHAQRLVTAFNKIQSELPKMLPVGRYNDDPELGNDQDRRGHWYGQLKPLQTYPPGYLSPAPAGSKKMGYPNVRNYFASLASYPGVDRYRALNVMAVAERGDIEFRFPHSTMNIATISGWFQMLAELIDFAVKHDGGWEEFTQHNSAEAPEVNSFLAAQRSRSSTSQDPTAIQTKPSRSVSRLLRRPRGASKPKKMLTPETLELALTHEPSPDKLPGWISQLRNIVDMEAAPPDKLEEIKQRLAELEAVQASQND